MSYLTEDINIMGIRSVTDYLAEQHLGVRKEAGEWEGKDKETWLNLTAGIHSLGLTKLTLSA